MPPAQLQAHPAPARDGDKNRKKASLDQSWIPFSNQVVNQSTIVPQ
jgi:hypothetical protein